MEASSKRSPERTFWHIVVWLIALIGTALLGIGAETVWILFLLWFPVYVAIGRSGRVFFCMCLISALVLIPHTCGYKILGSEYFYNNTPFSAHAIITSFGPGTTVTLSDGRTLQLAGIKALPQDDHTMQSWVRWDITGKNREQRDMDLSLMSYEQPGTKNQWGNLDCSHRLWEINDGIPAQIHVEKNGVAQIKIGYGSTFTCGNSYMATLFPRRFPRYRTRDLGLLLLSQGMAVEPDGSTTDSDYQKKLTQYYRPKDQNK